VKDLAERVSCLLPPHWTVRLFDGCLYVLQEALQPFRVKRAICYFFNGELSVEADGQRAKKSCEIYKNDALKPPGPLSSLTVESVASAIKLAAYVVQTLARCTGVDADNCIEEWPKHPACRLFDQDGDSQRMLRTRDCPILIPRSMKRCTPCHRYQKVLKKRETRRSEASPGKVNENVRHNILTPKRLKIVLKAKQGIIRKQAAQLKRLRERVAKMVGDEGITLDDGLEGDLSECFENADGLVKIFWEEQKKAHSVNKASGMKWHPFMIRWALHIKSTSSAAYSALRETGLIKLPSERTLYEYIHANPANEGIQEHVVERLAKTVSECRSDFFSLFVLMFDEMYLYKNIVYHKGTGAITGYVKLNEIEQELVNLERELNDDKEVTSDPPVASTMLTYMVRRVAGSADAAVVACYSCAALNKEQHKSRTWDVIGELELAGLQVIALVGDGSSANAAFFDSHPSLFPTESGVVYATLNIFTKDRPLFFISDPPHLLKTSRNCLYNSGTNKNTRLLERNGQTMSWTTIIACLKSEEKDDLKFCHKLNNNNVFLNGYSVMKVSLAAQVLSKTVALYIANESGMKNTEELVKFIMYVNNFFDCLNGAHSSQAVKTRNPNLAPYTDENDKRFDYLMEFLNYIRDWQAEVAALPLTDAEKRRRLMSPQWYVSVERTILAFIGVVKFCLSKRSAGPDGELAGYIMARVFQQDPLEHFYSRQRGCGGGNVHPTLQRFLENMNLIDLQGNLGIKRRRGNTQPLSERVDPDLPVQKRKKSNRKLTYDVPEE